MSLKLTILGSGSSTGSPAIGNNWGVLDPLNPKNRRTRCSALIETSEHSILIDTSPDLYQQMIACDIRRINSVLYTHPHADHLHGIDDLRGINRMMKSKIDLYAPQEVLTCIKERFSYVLTPLKNDGTNIYKPWVESHLVEQNKEFAIGGINIMPLQMSHGKYGEPAVDFLNTGYVFNKKIAYTTDLIHFIDEEFAFQHLQNLDLWVIGCISKRPHHTHLSLDKVMDLVNKLHPKEVIITHMSCGLDYQDVDNITPDNVKPAYDGMQVIID